VVYADLIGLKGAGTGGDHGGDSEKEDVGEHGYWQVILILHVQPCPNETFIMVICGVKHEHFEHFLPSLLTTYSLHFSYFVSPTSFLLISVMML
jgi:hypothetical protein